MKLRMLSIQFACVAIAIIAGSASAQDVATPPAANKTDAASEARLKTMRQIIEGIKVETVAEAGSHPIPQVDGPSFRYDAPDVSCDDGTAWIWGEEKKRPTVILTLSSWPSPRDGFWSYEFTTLCSQKLHIVGKDNVKWTPREGGLQFSRLPDALTPAETHARRLTQMKTMARRFTAHGVYRVNDRIELRVLPTPIYRYEDRDESVVDAAIFFIAGGVNPEAMLALELSADGAGNQTWNYALNRVSAGELHVFLGDREIWSTETLNAEDPTGAYFLAIRPIRGDEP